MRPHTLSKGTVATEVELGASHAGQSILSLPWGKEKLRIGFLEPDLIEARIGQRSGTISVDDAGGVEIARLCVSWDIARGWAELSLDRPESATFKTAGMSVADPMILAARSLHQAVFTSAFLAISSRIEPLGPMPALTAMTPVLTRDGYVPVSKLRRGDMVLTGHDTWSPVLHVVKHTVPARGRFAPIRLRAPYLELRHDIVVSADQKVELRGTEVEYCFGKEAVYVRARALSNGFAAHTEPSGPFMTYYHVVLPSHDSLEIAGTCLESLYIGRMRRHPGQLYRSLFRSSDKNLLPGTWWHATCCASDFRCACAFGPAGSLGRVFVEIGRHLRDNHGVFVQGALHQLALVVVDFVPLRFAFGQGSVSCYIQWCRICLLEDRNGFAHGLGLVDTTGKAGANQRLWRLRASRHRPCVRFVRAT